LFVEVDGYAYHHSPEQKANDERRRNRLRLDGNIVLVYTWRDVVGDGARVLNEIRRALATQRAAG
ncbi:MAG: PDDEXK family nuclease, partial [Acidimicrobiales bacterium]